MKRTGLSQRPMDYSTSFRTRNFAQPLTREQLRRPLWSTAFSRRSWTSWKVRSLVYISVFFVSIHLYAQRFRDWFISHYLFAAIRPSDDQYSYHKSCHFFPDDRGMIVGLRRRQYDNHFEVSWHFSNQIPPFDELPYNQSVLQNSVLINTDSGNYSLIMKKENSEIIFRKPTHKMTYKTLCIANKLNLRWA